MTQISKDAQKFLQEKYNESGRHYHNSHHIEYLLSQIDVISNAIKLTPQEKDALEIAIWFHDCEYNPKAEDNEEQSALQATKFYASHEMMREIFQAISDTRHHIPSSGNLISLALCDLDLLPLAETPEQYSIATARIRKEYSHYSTDEYIRKRIEFLKERLAYDRIYHTDYAYKEFEDKARRNMKNELMMLDALSQM